MNFWKNSKRPSTPPPHFWKIILRIFMTDMVAGPLGLFSSFGAICWTDGIGMVIIGHRSSKSTLGANKIIIEIIGSRYSFGRGPFGRILEWRGELQSKEWLQHGRGRLHRLCLYCSEVRWDPTGNSEAKIWLNPTYNKEFDGSELLSLVPDYHWCILLTFDLYMNEVIAF